MNRRRVSRTLGLAAGGSLGAVLLSAAVAVADDNYQLVPDPGSTETVTGLTGSQSTGPAAIETLQGYQPFQVMHNGHEIGTVSAFEYAAPYLSGTTNTAYFVTPDVPGSENNTTDLVPPGSVFATSGALFGVNVYSAIPSSHGDVVTDTVVTPFGNVDFTWLYGSFDAAEGLAAHAPPTALPPGIVDDPASTPVYTGISGYPPMAVAVQGYQLFDVQGADGGVDGKFYAFETPTHDILGIHTEALLVTHDVSGTPGTGPGDVPPVGSVFNTMVWGDWQNIYSALPTSHGDDVTDTLVTPLGNVDLSWLFEDFDAAEGLGGTNSPTQQFSFGDLTITPEGQEVLTGINGLPPLQAVIQGTQQFSVFDGSDQAGTFDAHVATTPNMMISDFSQTLIVTDASGDVGTGPGEVPPVGSVFDIRTFGFGFENVYAALATSGSSVIKDTLVTPLGPLDLSWLVQGGFDAAQGLHDVDYASLVVPPEDLVPPLP